MHRYNISFLICLLLPSAVFGTPSAYVCIPDSAIGYYFDKETEKWTATTFSNEGRKYVLSETEHTDLCNGDELNDFEKSICSTSHEVKQIGSNDPAFTCQVGSAGGRIDCESILQYFIFTPNTGKYIRVNLFGYILQPSELPQLGKPFLEIGKCSKL